MGHFSLSGYNLAVLQFTEQGFLLGSAEQLWLQVSLAGPSLLTAPSRPRDSALTETTRGLYIKKTDNNNSFLCKNLRERREPVW